MRPGQSVQGFVYERLDSIEADREVGISLESILERLNIEMAPAGKKLEFLYFKLTLAKARKKRAQKRAAGQIMGPATGAVSGQTNQGSRFRPADALPDLNPNTTKFDATTLLDLSKAKKLS